uniref:Uncharacterized protein n=1 Tax=Salix viminalis TaxID=40686 RepID=A0A6N2K3J9_SALVM
MKKNASQLLAMEIPSADQSYFWRATSWEFAFQPESLMEVSLDTIVGEIMNVRKIWKLLEHSTRLPRTHQELRRQLPFLLLPLNSTFLPSPRNN